MSRPQREPAQRIGQQRRIRRDDHDDRAVLARAALRHRLGDLGADRHAGDRELRPAAEVRLHEGADGEAAQVGRQHARRRADSALEREDHHARAAADAAFRHRAAAGGIHRREDIRRLHVLAEGVVQEPVVGLADHRQHVREQPFLVVAELAPVPRDDRVAHHAHAARAREHHRPAELADLLDQGPAGQLARAVGHEHARRHEALVRPSLREHGGDAGAHRARADFQGALAPDQRAMPDFDTGDVGDGVASARHAVERHAEVARARAGVGGAHRGREHTQGQAAQQADTRHGELSDCRNLASV